MAWVVAILGCIFEAMPYHHYVSAFHLAEFSANPARRRRDSKIWVHDLDQRRSWRTSAAKAGGHGNYNTLQNVPGVDPEAVEGLISEKIEKAASDVIRQTNTNLTLPNEDEWEALFTYLALLQVNNPARRGALEDAQNQALTFMGQMMLASPDTFERAQAECRRDGVPLLGDMTYEQLEDMLASGISYTVPITQHVRGLGKLVDTARKFLSERKWSLLVAAEEAPNFICGDHPVVGLPSMDPEVVIPLGRRICLLSQRDPIPPRVEVGLGVVAEVNRRQLDAASRFVYSSIETLAGCPTSLTRVAAT